jgi:hypothetical protein
MEHPVDGGGGLLNVAALLQEEFDLVLADSGLGPAAMIGSELGDELFVLFGSLVG